MELFTLIQLGSRIGAVEAMLYILATFLLGLAMLRAQGMGIVNKLRAAQGGAAVIPQQLLGDELALGLAALLLMVPGLITDFLALIVLLGPLRRRIFTALGGTVHAATYQSRTHHESRPGDPIEGEFRRLDDDER
ncbi:FxsA cytoplasmic membrane protein [gamma proteobacterium NOR5-3]|nr:FxsA cytoplasmic membrane protein [gamma proteobacterium NOR5-3]